MILETSPNVNLSYACSLALLYFPGEKFGSDERSRPDAPRLSITLSECGGVFSAAAKMEHGGQSGEGAAECRAEDFPTPERAGKTAVAKAVFVAGEAALRYRPSWGILAGIRPAKFAGELYGRLGSKAATRRLLIDEYMLTPKKATLASDIAAKESHILRGFDPRTTCSLYISIPFCPTRCAYCSFVSFSTKRLLSLIPDYIERLLLDIDRTVEMIRERGKTISTVYIGGGTPTVLDEYKLESLLDRIAERVDPNGVREFSIEAGRPDTISAQKLHIIKKYGVNRISINPQTLSDEILRGIGRAHTCDDFFRAFNLAREVGIGCINTDVIAGLPGDGYGGFSATVDKILALRPENFTVHTFCVKKAAEVRHSGVNVYSRNGGDTSKSVDYSQIAATNEGYKPYYLYKQKNTVGNLENVGFALDGFEGLYNILMMEEHHDVYGVGAASVTKLLQPDGQIRRKFEPKYPYEYLK